MFFDKFIQIILVMTCDKDQEMAEGSMDQSNSKWSLSGMKTQGAGGKSVGVGGGKRKLQGLMFDRVLFNIFINDPEEG